jgi:hypothetical protein
MSIGGAITSATAGSILYAGASGNLAQDNANFYYDYTNHCIGLGITSPNTSSLIDMTSTTKGMTLPRMSHAQMQAIATPTPGMMIYTTDFTQPYFYGQFSSWYPMYVPWVPANYFNPSTLAFAEPTQYGTQTITVTAPSTSFSSCTITLPAATGTFALARSVNVVSTNIAAGTNASTDYVYFCSGTMNLTLPAAAGNTNKYTVKNTGGTITLVGTVDGTVNLVMTTTNVSIDLISDGTIWRIV